MLTDVVIANKSYTRLSVPEDGQVDWIALKVIKQDCPDFLLPVKVMEIDGEQEVRYELLDGIRLSYSGLNINRKDFNTLLCNMLMPFKTCSDWFLDYHNLLLDNDHILIGRSGYTVKYLYIPTAEYTQSDAQIMEYFMDLILRTEIQDDQHYAMDLLRILKSDNANLMTLLDYVMRDAAAGQGAESQGIQGQALQGQNLQGQTFQGQTLQGQNLQGETFQGQNLQGWAEPKVSFQPGQMVKAAEEPVQKIAEAVRAKKTAVSEPEKKNSASAGARPGQTTGEFGKSDVQSKLAGSLFGDDEEEEAKKNPKESKHKGGLFDRLKGKPKEESAQERGKRGKTTADAHPAPPAMFGERAADSHMPPPPPFFGQGNQSGQQGSAGFSGQGNQGGQQGSAGFSGQVSGYSYEAEDVTEITADINEEDNNVLRLRLIDNAGYNCPGMIEIDLQKGFATVGRLDKSGNAQSDFCFDASLSFISRRHFRVEREGSQWVIIDLNSGNGTFVNEEALAPNIRHPLRSGDMILLSRKQRLKYQVC